MLVAVVVKRGLRLDQLAHSVVDRAKNMHIAQEVNHLLLVLLGELGAASLNSGLEEEEATGPNHERGAASASPSCEGEEGSVGEDDADHCEDAQRAGNG